MLQVNLCGKIFKNPIIAASGTFGFGEEYGEFYDVSKLGGISSKGLTLNPKEGNNGIRIYETSSGIMNSVGLQNPGVDKFIKEELPKMKKIDTVTIANVGGGCIEDYIEVIEKLNKTDVDIIELNISCPNVKHGGMAFGIKSEIAYEVVKKVKDGVKILGNGNIEKKLTVKAAKFSKSAIEKIEAAGGKVEVI